MVGVRFPDESSPRGRRLSEAGNVCKAEGPLQTSGQNLLLADRLADGNPDSFFVPPVHSGPHFKSGAARGWSTYGTLLSACWRHVA